MEGIGWGAIVIAVIAGIRGEIAAMTARRVARDKAEADRLAARDKMEFDAKLQALTAEHVACAENTAQMQADILKCRDQHADSERDRAEMKGRVAVMESLLAAKIKAG